MVRITVTTTIIRALCPFCNKRPLKKATCGHPVCQFKRHILIMRQYRKTEQVRPSRRIEI